MAASERPFESLTAPMNDSRKTKSELLKELASLRLRVEELSLQVEEWKRLAGKRKEMVEESESRFVQLTEDLEEVFWMYTFGAKPEFYVSPAYEKIWGRSRESLYDNPYSYMESIHPHDWPRVEKWLEHHAQGMQYRIIRPDGAVRWIADRRFRLFDEQGTLRKVVGFACDITSMREKFIKFQQAERTAALERIAAFVAHETRNPLQIICGGVESLKITMGDEAKCKEILEELVYGVTALEDVISQLIFYALPVHLHASEMTIEELIDSALAKVRPQLEKTAVHQQLSPNTGKMIYVDKEKMVRALSNMLVNAAEAMPDGGNLWIRTTFRADRAAIAISDSGRGISPEIHARVTEPFFTTKPEGIGLGLSISRKIIEAHIGTMVIPNKKDEGTTVKVFLPSH
jgi:two-component system cell cycle sensor histidine kinase/response regulator CckA